MIQLPTSFQTQNKKPYSKESLQYKFWLYVAIFSPLPYYRFSSYQTVLCLISAPTDFLDWGQYQVGSTTDHLSSTLKDQSTMRAELTGVIAGECNMRALTGGTHRTISKTFLWHGRASIMNPGHFNAPSFTLSVRDTTFDCRNFTSCLILILVLSLLLSHLYPFRHDQMLPI